MLKQTYYVFIAQLHKSELTIVCNRVIQCHELLEKSIQGSAFQFDVADPLYFATTIKLLCNNNGAAWKRLGKNIAGVRILVAKTGVRQGSAGSAGGPQESAFQDHPCIWSPLWKLFCFEINLSTWCGQCMYKCKKTQSETLFQQIIRKKLHRWRFYTTCIKETNLQLCNIHF